MNQEKFRQITTNVRYWGIGKIEKIIEEHKEIKNQNLIKKQQKLILDICEGRDICKVIGIKDNDYAFLPEPAMKRIKVYALLLVKEDQNFIFPYPI